MSKLLVCVALAVLAMGPPAASATSHLTSVTQTRLDPHKSHRLRRAGHEVVKYRAGGDPGLYLKSPGRTKVRRVTLQRG